MQWRVIPLETLTAARAMASEEVLMESVASGGTPTIRSWLWDPSAVTVGRFQDASKEVDLELARELGVDVVRRMSGGGTVFHQQGSEFVYSITAPSKLFPGDVVRTYSAILGLVMKGMSAMGVGAVLEGNSIMVAGHKVSGASQRRARGALQVHGTVLYQVDEERMFSVLRARPGDVPEGRATPSRHHPVTGLADHLDATFEQVHRTVMGAMLHGRVHKGGTWTAAESQRTEDLERDKYSLEEWNLDL